MPHLAYVAVLVTLASVLLALGGTLYEHLVVDLAWLRNPQLIQPGHGGLDRKVFWIPIHVLLTLGFLVAIPASWSQPAIRLQILVAAGAYLVMRVWTALYFIPVALAFETATIPLPAELAAQARTWVVLSTLRAPLFVVGLVTLWRAQRGLGRLLE